jgi:hypothetical protein
LTKAFHGAHETRSSQKGRFHTMEAPLFSGLSAEPVAAKLKHQQGTAILSERSETGVPSDKSSSLG